jgi:hemerythrin-like domain-containing protein
VIQIGEPSATLDSPLEHLVACHRRIEQRLETLVKAADRLEHERQPALEAIAKSIHFLDSNGLMHTEDEEDSLFPRLRPKLSSEELAFVDLLGTQHNEAEEILAELKKRVEQISQQQPSAEVAEQYRECATRLQSFYGEHIRSEERTLGPLAKRYLTESEFGEISREMRARRKAGE